MKYSHSFHSLEAEKGPMSFTFGHTHPSIVGIKLVTCTGLHNVNRFTKVRVVDPYLPTARDLYSQGDIMCHINPRSVLHLFHPNFIEIVHYAIVCDIF